MPDILQPLDGLITTEFQLVVPQQPPVALDASVVAYQGSTLTESVYTTATHEHRFLTSRLPLVDQILRLSMSGATPRFRFRYGLESAQSKIWMPWQDHLLYAHSTTPNSVGDTAGHSLLILTKDRMTEIDRASKVIARKGLISDIVAGIANANGVEAIIEPTRTEGVYTQSFLSDIEFIRHRLLSRAVNRKGLSNYFFFFKDNVLHFHTLDYQSRIKSLSYFNSTGTSLVITDNTEKMFDSGIAGVRLIVHDPYTGQSKEVSSDPNQVVRLADTVYPAGAIPGGPLNVGYHLSTNSPDETTGIAQSPYAHARLTSLTITAEFSKFIDIRHGDFLNLILSQRESNASPYSGLWFVVQVTSNIENGTIVTQLSLVRGENQRVQTDTGVLEANAQVIPALTAPGQDPNLNEIAASALTKGVGSQASEKVFVTVSDASKGPAA